MFWEGDSGLFQEMGICLLQGGVPYVDLFDHKGPFLWYIQSLGLWLNFNWGLMLLQIISLFCTMTIWYKTVQMLVDKQIYSIIIPIVGLIILLAFYERGNLCEEWSLPFISLPLLLYLKRWERKGDNAPIYTHTDIFIVSICAGILTMIRINNAAPLIGFVLLHFINSVRHRDFRRLWKDMLLICGGVSMVFVLCSMFYLVKAGWYGLYEMIYGAFVYNLLYIGKGVRHTPMYKSYIIPALFLIIGVFLLKFDKSHKGIILAVLISLVASLLSIGTRGFKHYMIIFIPVVIVVLCLISYKKWLSALLLPVIILNTIYVGYSTIDLCAFRLLGKQSDTALKDGFHDFVAPMSSVERKSIYNLSLNHYESCLFAYENIYQCNRIVYRVHVSVSPRLQAYEKTHGVKDIQPIWVLTQGPIPETTDEYMKLNYSLADSISGGPFDPVWCWKKKE